MSDLEVLLNRIDNLLNENIALRMENERLMRENHIAKEIQDGLIFMNNDLKRDLRNKQ